MSFLLVCFFHCVRSFVDESAGELRAFSVVVSRLYAIHFLFALLCVCVCVFVCLGASVRSM